MTHWSSNVKKRVVEIYLNSNITQENVAKMFAINTRTLQRWLYEYKKDGDLERKKQVYYSYKNRRKTCKIYLKNFTKKSVSQIQIYLLN